MKTELIEKALSLIEKKRKLAVDLCSVLNRAQVITNEIENWRTSQSIEDCVECLPENVRPKIIPVPLGEGIKEESVLLQLNPLVKFGLWVFLKITTTTRGQFRFSLGEGIISKQFSMVCGCNSCMSQEKVAPSLIELCCQYGITTIFLRLRNQGRCTLSHEGKSLHLFEALHCWGAFKDNEKVDAKQCVFFDSIADESFLSKGNIRWHPNTTIGEVSHMLEIKMK